MENKKLGKKIIPPPPFPPLLLIQELSKMERMPIYQPNRDLYSNVTLSLNNLVNVERHITERDFERKKEYDKKSEMCKNFKQQEENQNQGFFGSFLNNLNPLSRTQTSNIKRNKKEKEKEKEKEQTEEKEEKQDNKLPKGTIILDNIKISDEVGVISKYNKYLMEWHKN